jgi:hypothetical protein
MTATLNRVMALLLPAAVVLVSEGVEAQRGGGRLRPPDAVTCPRDRLTLHVGRVLALDRLPDRTILSIVTDDQTIAKVQVTHLDAAGPVAFFLMKGKPFTTADWAAIETSGKLREGVRAAAWVCDDGRNPLIDWEQPSEQGR